ncbi:MAG: methyl-accepting chemotaxis protein [Rhodospirillaceae bacterium]|nr:MAG: methyl-accepting chemotaxis protein [Rhodospirillaceae bacterium]
MSLQTTMGQVRVGTRIYVGFLAVLILLGTVGLVGWSGLSDVGIGVDNYARISNNTLLMQGYNIGGLEMRRNVLNYTFTGDEMALRRAREARDSVARDLETYLGRGKNVARKRIGETVRTSLNDYSASFDKAVTTRQRRQSIVEERLNPLGAEMRRHLSTLIVATTAEKDWETAAGAGQVQEQLMLVRLNTLRFLNTADKKLVEAGKEQFMTLKKGLASVSQREEDPEHRKIVEMVEVLVPKYEAAFTDVVTAATELDELVRQTLPKLGEHFDQAVATLLASQIGKVKDESEYKGSQEWAEKTTLDKVTETQNFTLTLSG